MARLVLACFSLFDSSVIASSLSPSKETLAILTDFLQRCPFSNCRSFKPEVEEFGRLLDLCMQYKKSIVHACVKCIIHFINNDYWLESCRFSAQFSLRRSEFLSMVFYRLESAGSVSKVDIERGSAK